MKMDKVPRASTFLVDHTVREEPAGVEMVSCLYQCITQTRDEA